MIYTGYMIIYTEYIIIYKEGYIMKYKGYKIQDTGYRINNTKYRMQEVKFFFFLYFQGLSGVKIDIQVIKNVSGPFVINLMREQGCN